MGDIFFISDTHFGDKKIYKIRHRHFNKWKSVDKMNEELVNNWNGVVSKKDTVYHLGDVAMTKKSLQLLSECNGKKILIKGNHDEYDINEYLKLFHDIHGIIRFDKYFLSHAPIHTDMLPRWCKANIHGHIHSKVVLDENGLAASQYSNVSVEQLSFTPIQFGLLNLKIAKALNKR